MALILRPPATSFAIKKLHSPLYLPPHSLPSNPKLKDLTIKSQDSSSSTPKSPEPSKPTESTNTSSSSAVAPPPPQKQPNSAAGLGFGSSASTKSSNSRTSPTPAASKKKQKGKKERASIIRRAPLEKPSFAAQNNEVKDKEQSQNESAFLLAWLGLGAIILVQGLILAASGFLPEEWDNFFAKFLYPSFTPTVVLFVVGTVAYGVLKYLQNENLKNDD